MARKRRKSRHWLRNLLLFIMTPLLLWTAAFVIWLFWYDIQALISPGDMARGARVGSPAGGERKPGNDGRAKRAAEEIPEADRRRLDDILKRR